MNNLQTEKKDAIARIDFRINKLSGYITELQTLQIDVEGAIRLLQAYIKELMAVRADIEGATSLKEIKPILDKMYNLFESLY